MRNPARARSAISVSRSYLAASRASISITQAQPRSASATHFGQNQRPRIIRQSSALAALSAVKFPIAAKRNRSEQLAQSIQHSTEILPQEG